MIFKTYTFVMTIRHGCARETERVVMLVHKNLDDAWFEQHACVIDPIGKANDRQRFILKKQIDAPINRFGGIERLVTPYIHHNIRVKANKMLNRIGNAIRSCRKFRRSHYHLDTQHMDDFRNAF